jgi:hypothetical protein
MLFDLGQNDFERVLRGRVDLNPRRAAIGAAMSDMNVDYPKLGAKIDNEIENLGENQRVNDMTGNVNDAPRHTNLSTCIHFTIRRGQRNIKISCYPPAADDLKNTAAEA